MKRVVAAAAPLALLLAAACGGDDGGGSASIESWCATAERLDEESSLLDDVDPFDPESIEAAYSEFRSLVEDARSAAPEEIRDDVATLADGVIRVDEELAAADYNFLDVDISFMDELSAEMDAASTRLDEFNERECGFEIDADDDLGDLGDLGDTGGSGDTGDSGDEGAGGLGTGSGTVRDQLVAELVGSGFSETEAQCVADNLDITQMANAEADPTVMLQVFDDCGIDLARLAELGG